MNYAHRKQRRRWLPASRRAGRHEQPPTTGARKVMAGRQKTSQFAAPRRAEASRPDVSSGLVTMFECTPMNSGM